MTHNHQLHLGLIYLIRMYHFMKKRGILPSSKKNLKKAECISDNSLIRFITLHFESLTLTGVPSYVVNICPFFLCFHAILKQIPARLPARSFLIHVVHCQEKKRRRIVSISMTYSDFYCPNLNLISLIKTSPLRCDL